MNKLKLQQQAFAVLISMYRPKVVSILNKYGYNASSGSSNLDLARDLVNGIQTNSNLTNDVISLMNNIVKGEKKSGDDGSSSGVDPNVSAIISGALSGIGQIDATWKYTSQTAATAEDNAATIAATANLGVANITQTNVLTRGEKIGLVIGG